jgi:PAS domain S-box-containing protein
MLSMSREAFPLVAVRVDATDTVVANAEDATLVSEPTFWSQNKTYAVGGLTILAAQILLIGALVLQGRRRRSAERALSERDEHYRVVVEMQSDMMCRCRPDSTLTFVNDAYCRYRRKTADQLVGTRILDRLPDDAREELRAHFASLNHPPHVGRMERDVKEQDGSTRCYEWITHAMLGADGRVCEFLGTGRDITDRKQAENALRRSEARTTAILRLVPDLMFVMSRDGVYVDYHARDHRDLFVPPEQFLGKTVFDVMPPDLAPIFAQAIASADSTSEPKVVEYALQMPDGERFFETRMVASDADQVLSIVRETTDQKRAERRLRVNEARYALATAAGGVGIWEWAIDTGELYVDPEVLQILGYPRTVAPGSSFRWNQMVHPQDHEYTQAAALDYLNGRAGKFDIEHRVLRKDGSVRWFHTCGTAVRPSTSGPQRMSGTFTDVTDRKRAQESLRAQDAELRQSYQEIQDLAGRLIAGQELERKRIARELHDDLSQKLALLSIEVDLMKRSSGEPRPPTHGIAERVASIASDVHSLSHRLHPFKLEALGLVEAIRALCADVSKQYGLKVDFVNDSLPPQLPPDLSLCLFRIVQEGLRNVVKHSGSTDVWVQLSASTSEVSLQIADCGAGFVPADHVRTGLGLISMRERINFVGGRLAIRSLPGFGTRIGVRVPLRAPVADAVVAPSQSEHLSVESA